MAKAFIFELTKVVAYYMTFKMFDSIQQQTKNLTKYIKNEFYCYFNDHYSILEMFG